VIQTDSVRENQLESLENIQKLWRCEECTDLFEHQDTALEHYEKEHIEGGTL